MGNYHAGSIKLGLQSGTELTDAAATYVKTIRDVGAVGSLYIDIASDKGCTVDGVRYLDAAMTIAGTPFTQGVVADGGPSGSFIYNDLGCSAVVITVTKTEAGTSSGFAAAFRGKA